MLGTEEALVEPMLLARDTMLLFRAFSMKSAGIKSIPGSVPKAGCDRAQGREGRPRAAAATQERGWRGPGAARAPTGVQAIVAVGRVHLRGAGGRRRHVSGAGAGAATRAPEPPAPRSSVGPRSSRHPRAAALLGPLPPPLAPALTRVRSPLPRPGAHPARPPRAPSRRAALRPRGTQIGRGHV